MYLKRLELLGFKSFADRTQFAFRPGITAIVGPNGCGKSNVVDAFKWIFGEQSAKGLRGSEMKDVIFNGTQERKPTGYAEVSVTFDNTDRFLAVDYAEVEISRRLFRSGESEYLINKQKCRLKDIRELFLDTGVGRTSYSILEQGKIDVLLQASTLDRRVIFEEAAGISKYRVRKAEALRALVRVEDNLARLQDIIDEVDKRVRRLKVQAGKARRYREHSERLKELRIRMALEDFTGSIDSRARLSFELFWRRERGQQLDDLLGRLERGLDGQRAARQELSAVLKERQDALAKERIARERTLERLRQAERRVTELEETSKRTREDLDATRASLTTLRKGLRVEEAQLADLCRTLEERRERIEVAASDLSNLQSAHRSANALVESGRDGVVQLMRKEARLANALVQVESEMANLAGRGERLDSALSKLSVELARCGERRGAAERRLEDLAGQLRALGLERTGIESGITELRNRTRALEHELAETREDLHRKSSRYDVLRSFEEDLDGVAAGVAEVLRRQEDLPEGLRSVGMLASLLHVDRAYAAAVEAALGSLAQALVFETQDGALEVLRLVEDEKLGRVEVVALDRVDAARPEWFARQGGVLGALRDKVRVEAGYEELADRLLANVVLVEDLPTAVAVSRNGLRPFRLVTLQGEVIEPWGGISVPGDCEPGILSRRSEMESLTEEVEALTSRCEALEADLQHRQAELEQWSARLREKDAEIEGVRRSQLTVEGEIAELGREQNRLERECEVNRLEFRGIQDEIEAREREKLEREAEVRETARERTRVEGEIQLQEELAGVLAGDVSALGELLGAARLEFAKKEKEAEGLRQLIERQVLNLEERDRHVRDLEAQLVMVGQRREEAEETIRGSRKALDDLQSREASLLEELRGLESKDASFEDVERAFRKEIERVRAVSQRNTSERESLQLRDQEERLRRNTILERIDEQYGIDLRALVDRRTEEQGAGAAGEARELEECPEARYLRPVEDWDREAAREEAKELQEKIRRLGNVNLEALEELEELEERLQFQLGQKNDLVEGQRNLRNIIGEINRKSRELFLDTFSKVQEHFHDLFRKCFGGGRAELVLEDGADVLEAGIEIVARPPGKKLTSLSLMSGGEKTMTTIALLLAIFRSRPSPFCVLDEVDAPLDEANVRRFVVLLKDFVEQSQFIIITHNKITMAEAEALYGVTMQERGVSRKVAVELETYDPERMEVAASETR